MTKDKGPGRGRRVFSPHVAPTSVVDPVTFHEAKIAAGSEDATPEQRRLARAAARRDRRTAPPARPPELPPPAVPTGPPRPTATDSKSPNARYIDGVEVIVDEPTPAPFRSTTVLHPQTRTLLLADGREVFACAHCDYWSENVRSIRPHLKVHSTPKPDPVPEQEEATVPTVPAPAAAEPTMRIVPTGTKGAPRVLSALPPAAIANLTLAELADRIAHVGEVEADRDQWRKRATDAEGQLEKVRRALAAAGLEMKIG